MTEQERTAARMIRNGSTEQEISEKTGLSMAVIKAMEQDMARGHTL